MGGVQREVGERWRKCQEEGSVYLSGRMREKECVCVRRGGVQLTGNLFLPFSLNKGCDWLLCIRPELQHGGDEKADHSKVKEAPEHQNFSSIRQQNSALYHTQITIQIP